MEPLSLFLLQFDQPAKDLLDKHDIKTQEQLEKAIARKQLSDAQYRLIEPTYQEHKRLCQQTRNRLLGDIMEVEEQYTPSSRHILESIVSDREPAILQIYGQKASGKSALLVELVHLYQQAYPVKTVLMLNCASGITIFRYNRIRNGLIYRDACSLSGIISILEQVEEGTQFPTLGMIVLDQPIKFVKIKEKPETEFMGLVHKLRLLAKRRKLMVVFTNSAVGEKLRLFNDQASFNEASQFSSSTSPFLDHRLSTHRMTDGMHFMVLLKSRFRWEFPKSQPFKVTQNGVDYFKNGTS